MEKIKKIINNNLDIVTFFVFVSIKFSLYSYSLSGSFLTVLVVLIPTWACLLILCGLSSFFNTKTRSRLLYTINIILTVIIIADIKYFAYYKDIVSIPVLKLGLLLGKVSSSVFALIGILDFIYVLDLFITPHHYFNKIEYVPNRKTKLKQAFSLLLIGTVLNTGSVFAMSINQPNLLSTMYSKIYVAENLGPINFHTIDSFNYVKAAGQKDTELEEDVVLNIEDFFDEKNSNKENSYTGLYEGSNLIIIQVEALQEFVIGSTVNDVEITPNLNKWIKKSTYFDNYFYQTAGGNTSDAEFITNNSLYPASEGATCYIYPENTLDSLPKALKKKDYYTSTYHGYTESFWNRSVMNQTEGFDDFIGESSYNIDEIVGMGLSDKSFFNQAFNMIEVQKEPYYSLLVTLSSHFPYDGDYDDFNVGEYEKTFIGNYLKSMHYADAQLGMFLDKLEADGTLDNSVVAIYGDHYAITPNYKDDLIQFLGMDESNDLVWAELQKVPLIMHFPKDENVGIHHEYAGQMDLYPTLANLFNLDSEYMLGNDLFSDEKGSIVFRNGSFADGKIFYLSGLNEFYDISTGKKIEETEELLNMKKDRTLELDYSDDILNHDLLKGETELDN
ncbi:MAG: LTA synthase family protein [Clostridiaceae bacterium]